MTPLAGPFFNSAAQGAWSTLQAATGANVQGGDYLGPQGLGEVSGRSGPARVARNARDPKLARELWQRSIDRSEEHTSELQSLMRISYAVFCLKKKNKRQERNTTSRTNNRDRNES